MAAQAFQLSPAATRLAVSQAASRISSQISKLPAGYSFDPAVRAERAAAAQMTDDEYWGWDRQYGTAVGLQAPTLVNLTKQGQCGGGGCNPSYSTSQYWRANVACSADVYGRVLFQYRRYVAAQVRLAQLLANPPQAWPGRMYFADTQDAQGNSTALPTRPPGEAALSAKAAEWADWCIEVSRHVAVAHWATAVRWCESDRAPHFYASRKQIFVGPDEYARWSSATKRDVTAGEAGTVASCLGENPPIIEAGRTDSDAIDAARYWPDVDRTSFGSYHPTGYFRPTTTRGSCPGRWTWGSSTRGLSTLAPRAYRGICEVGVSTLREASVFQAFRTTDGRFPLTDMEQQPRGAQYFNGTWLQLSECLATRNGNESGPHTWVMPEGKADFDPILNPQLVQGGGFYWPDDIARPTGSSVRDVLIALFTAQPVQARGLIDDTTLTNLRSQWALHWSSSGFRFMPAGLRQIWWCMAQAYDVTDTTFGTVVGGAFANFATGLNQLPPAFRAVSPEEANATVQAAAQHDLDGVFAVTSGIAGGIASAATAVSGMGPVGAVVGVVLYIVAALVELAGLLTQMAFSIGAARIGNPPVMPSVMTRVAGTATANDPCWLVASTDAGGGGAAALLPKAAAVQTAAQTSSDPTAWYAQVAAAIASGETPPPTPATVNKGVALGAGAIAGLALIKLLGG